MNIRMIPTVALAMVLGLAACQEEEAEVEAEEGVVVEEGVEVED